MIKNIISVINYFQWTNYIILFKSILVNIFYSFELFIAYESIAFYNKNEQTLIYGYLAMGSINSKNIFFIPTSLSLSRASLSLSFFLPKFFSLSTHTYTRIYIYIHYLFFNFLFDFLSDFNMQIQNRNPGIDTYTLVY